MSKKLSMIIIISILVSSLFYFIIFFSSHATYYKYNDWWIKGRTPEEVKSRYGEFDYETKVDAGYYIYSKSRGLGKFLGLGDNLDRYYCMDIDGKGVIYKVYVSVQKGG